MVFTIMILQDIVLELGNLATVPHWWEFADVDWQENASIKGIYMVPL